MCPESAVLVGRSGEGALDTHHEIPAVLDSDFFSGKTSHVGPVPDVLDGVGDLVEGYSKANRLLGSFPRDKFSLFIIVVNGKITPLGRPVLENTNLLDPEPLVVALLLRLDELDPRVEHRRFSRTPSRP